MYVCTNVSLTPIHSKVLATYTLLLVATTNADLFSKATRTKADERDLRNSVFDFIIIGGGTAGCVLANRLSAISDWKVRLVKLLYIYIRFDRFKVEIVQ